MADFRNTKEGRNVAQKYADILHLSRPEPPVKYPRMALSNRAKIFSPFAALRGFDDEISSEGASKLLVKKVELSDAPAGQKRYEGRSAVLYEDRRKYRKVHKSDWHSCYD